MSAFVEVLQRDCQIGGALLQRFNDFNEHENDARTAFMFNATYCEFGRKFFELTVSFLRPIPESEDRCGFDPTPDRVVAAPE